MFTNIAVILVRRIYFGLSVIFSQGKPNYYIAYTIILLETDTESTQEAFSNALLYIWEPLQKTELLGAYKKRKINR